MSFNHISKNSPPPAILPVVLKLKSAYRSWLILYRNFPKVERFGLGTKIDHSFLDTLEIAFCASYMPIETKVPLLSKAIARFDVLKFFMQLAWEHKLIPTEKYALFVTQLEEIGRQLGGWRKGLQTKTPANR